MAAQPWRGDLRDGGAALRALVSKGTYDFPAPSKYESTTATIVDSARNVKGYVIGSVIRENVAKVSMQWSFISAADWAALTAQFDSTRGGSFISDITFFNSDTNDWETRSMYVSDRTNSMYLRKKSGAVIGYEGAKLSLIDV